MDDFARTVLRRVGYGDASTLDELRWQAASEQAVDDALVQLETEGLVEDVSADTSTELGRRLRLSRRTCPLATRRWTVTQKGRDALRRATA